MIHPLICARRVYEDELPRPLQAIAADILAMETSIMITEVTA